MTMQGPLSGQTLGGKYLLGELLGKGGFGAVYKAENQVLGRPQAIKVLLEEHFSDAKFRERFLREARTLAALDHANIVHVDELGIQDNLVYLVMPYISGGTLQELMKARSGPLSLEEIGRYLEQICSALGYAHAQGVVHLDLKPSNLLIHQDGRLLLSDFGLAHLVQQGAVEGGTSLQFGSPLYMAPEHFDSRPEARSDLYAVGVILYQLLTGKHPFDAATPAAIMRKHLTEPPLPLRQARPDLPATLEAMMTVALAKQPEHRFQSAAALLVAFKQSVAGQAIGQSSGTLADAFAPTQVAQPLAYAPTLVNPMTPPGMSAGAGGPGQPMAGQMRWPPGGPIAPPPGYVLMPMPVPRPAARQSGQVWTPGFLVAFILSGAGALLLTLVSIFSLAPVGPFIESFTVSDGVTLLVQGGLLAVTILGIILAKSLLTRAGFVVLAAAALLSVIETCFDLYASINQNFTGMPLSLIFFYLPVLEGVLTAAGLICLSYSIARWQPPREFWFGGLQLLLTIVALVILLATAYIGPFSNVEFGNRFLFWVDVACMLLSVMVLLARPAAWRQSPIVVACLAVVALLFLLEHQPDGLVLFDLIFRPLLSHAPFVLYDRVTTGIYMLPYVAFIPGLLLFSQSERVRKHAQPAQPPQPAPVPVGQR